MVGLEPITIGLTMTTGDIRPRKSLGQHWLIDEQVQKDIIKLAELKPADKVLEIGPGMGILTKHLAASAMHVTAVELDSSLIKYLQNLKLNNVEIVNEDILSFNFANLSNYKIVANIPYYLTGKIIRLISELKNRPTVVVLLVQKEIAERLSADPGQLSILGLTTQYYFNVIKGPVVSADKFDPPPKVDSQIVKLVPKDTLLDEDTQKELFRLIKIGFSSKRKTILNNLSSGYMKDKDIIRSKSNINTSDRPQTLNLANWQEILKNLKVS